MAKKEKEGKKQLAGSDMAPAALTTGDSAGQQAIKEIEKKYGKGSIMTFTNDAVVACKVISTGDPAIDLALGVGGIPRGRIIEVYGPESSGKTTLTLHIIAEAQKAGGKAAFIDAEHALDPSWAKRIGVKIDELLISQPNCGEQALDIAEILVRGGDLDVIVIDSVAALIPQAEIDGEMGDSHMGLQARLMSQACRKLTGAISKTHTTVIFINQIREKIGVMFGNPETTTGGKALKFYASTRIDVRRTGSVKSGEVAIGNTVKVKIVKNKVAPPFKEAMVTIFFGDPVCGLDGATSLITLGDTHDIIDKSGAWYSYKSTRLGNGINAAATFLRENDDLRSEIWADIWAKVGPKKMVDEKSPEANTTGFDSDPVESPDEPPRRVASTVVRTGLATPPPDVITDDTSDGDDDVEDLISSAVGEESPG